MSLMLLLKACFFSVIILLGLTTLSLALGAVYKLMGIWMVLGICFLAMVAAVYIILSELKPK